MSSRKRRSQREESPSAEQPDVLESVEQQPRRKRRSSSAATPAAATAAAGADSDADNNAGAAAAAAAAAAGGGGGGDAAPLPRDRQPRVQFSQEEEAMMTQTIKRLEEEGEAALDRAAATDLPPASLDAAVSRVVRFVLFRHHEKPGVPIKRQDINDVISGTAGVGKGSKASKKLPGLVLPLASAKLATAFGMELRELKRGDTGAAAAAAAAAGADGGGAAAAAAAGGGGTAAAAASVTQTYKLLSMLPTELLRHCTQHMQDDQERGFVTTVLALLQLKQYRMDEDELWRHLGQLGMERDDPDAAEPFGGRHPTKILESMEHGRYLVKGRQAAPSSERGVLISYEWGEAAYSEFGGGVLDSVVTQFLKAGEDADGNAADADDDS